MDEPRTVSKDEDDGWIWKTPMWIVVVLAVAIGVTLHLSGARPTLGEGAAFAGGLAVLYLLMWRSLVGVYRPTGPNLGGVVVEFHSRDPFGPTADVAPGEAVEAWIPTETRLAFLITAPVTVSCLFYMAWFGVVEAVWARWSCMVAGAIGAVYWITGVLAYDRPRARVDADGATGYPSHPFHQALRPRFVPWSDVFGCEVETLYDNIGEPAVVRPILKGRHGETLMELYLADTPIDEQERIVEAIKARFPETEAEPRPA